MSSINDIVKKLRENRILNERKDYERLSREELINLAQNGDQLAIETLINTHKEFLSKMSRKYVLGGADKDDIEQMTMIAFWDAINSYDPDSSGDFEAFAGMVIKRKLTDELRKDSAGKREIHNSAQSFETPIAGDDEGGEATLGASIEDSGLSPEDQTIGKEGVRELLKFMRDRFSQQERDAVMMYIKGYKVSEIAEETGMKYKSVENALMRVKNKLADYLRTRESKKIQEKKIKFSDEEKQLLESVIKEVNMKEALRESAVSQMKESYEQYTEEQIESELDSIEYSIKDIVKELEDIPYDDRDELLDQLDDLRSKLSAMEDYLTDEQYKKSDDLLSEIGKAEDIEYVGETPPTDPYKERGLKQSDFY